MNENFIKIYGLKLMENDDIFYVGSTKLNLQKRLKRHKLEILSENKTTEQLKFFEKINIDDIEIVLLEDNILECERLSREDEWYYKLLNGNNLINSKQPSLTWGQSNKNTPFGEKQYNSKLTDTKVKQIINLYKFTKMSVIEISKLYNVVWQTISRIVDGENWKHINNGEKTISIYPKRFSQDDRYKFSNKTRKNRKLSNDNVLEIINLYKQGMSQRELSEIFKINRSVISDILSRKQYRDVTENIQL